MPVKRIDHIVLLVHDLQAAKATYLGCFGMPVAWEDSEIGELISAGVSLGNANLELLTTKSNPTTPNAMYIQSVLQTRGQGLLMMALDSGDIAETVAEATARGATLTPLMPGKMTAVSSGDVIADWTNAFFTPSRIRGATTFFCQTHYCVDPEPGGGPMNIKKLDHVVIATTDLEDAVKLWERNVGLRADTELNHPLGAGFKAARLPIGESFIELVQPVEESGRFYEQVKERGEGLFSISIQVDDLDEAVRHLRENGATVSDPEPSIWPDARLARINRNSTHGVSIQLIERS